MALTSQERQYRCTPKYYDRLDAGLAADLEVGDRVIIQHGEHPGVVLEVRNNSATNYKLRKVYRVQLFESHEVRWVNRDQIAYQPSIRRLKRRAARVRELWSPRDRYERARWAANGDVGIRVFTGNEVLTPSEL